MKKIMILTIWASGVHAVFLNERQNEGDCVIEWVTVDGYGLMTSSPAPSSSDSAVVDVQNDAVGNSASSTPQPIATSTPVNSGAPSMSVVSSPLNSTSSFFTNGTAGSSTGISMPTINGDNLKAPVASDAVPAGAAVYTSPDRTKFDGNAFMSWLESPKTAKLASKFLKIAPGTYAYDLNSNIAIGSTPGGWTLDMRGVTFLVSKVDGTPGQAIYINQSTGLTILGGTIWFDQGEIWTQATCTSVANGIETFKVQQGYNVSAWRTAGAQNQGCMDTSDPNHYTRPNCNFWGVDTYDFSKLDSDGTWTAKVVDYANMKEGYIIVMQVGPNGMPTTIASEFNGGLHVKGMTSNGGTAQYGLQNTNLATGIFEDVWTVNPPPDQDLRLGWKDPPEARAIPAPGLSMLGVN